MSEGDRTQAILDTVNGRTVVRRATPEEIRALREAGREDLIIDTPTSELEDAELGALLEREQGDRPVTSALEGAANMLGAGVPEALRRQIDPEAAIEAQARRELNPGATALGQVGAAIGTAGLALGEGALGQAARGTTAGFSAAAGQAVEQALASRFTSALGQRVIAPMAGAGVDAAIGGAALAFENSLVNNQPLTAENLIADVGISSVLGLGLGGAFGGGRYALSRGRQRVGRAMSERLARAGLEEGAQNLNPLFRAGLAVSEALGFASDDARRLADRNVRRAAAEGFERAGGLVNQAREALDGHIQVGREITPGATRRAGRFRQLLEGVDGAPLAEALGTGLARARNQIASALPRSSSTAVSGIRRRAQEAIERAANLTPSNAGDVVEIIDSLDNQLAQLRAPGNLSGAGRGEVDDLLNIIAGQRNELTALLANPGLVGPSAAGAINQFREIVANADQLEAQLLREFGSEVSEDGALRQAIDGDKLTRLFREAATPESDRRMNLVRDYLEAAESRNNAVAELFDIDPTDFEGINALAGAVRQGIDEGAESFRALGIRERALRAERGEAGFAIVAGISGTAVGGLVGSQIGGGEGAAVGAGLGLGASAIMRPASFLTLLGNMERGVERLMGRRTRAINRLRSTLQGRSGSLTRAGGAGTRQVPALVRRLTNRQTSEEEYNRLVEDVRALATNPGLFEERFNATMGELSEALPAVYDHTVGVSQRAAQYLMQNLPATEAPSLFDDYLDMPPSQTEMDAFARRVEAIEDPFSILDRAADFTLHPDSVDAVAFVYPELYRQIQSDAMSVVDTINSLPPYQARIQMGTLLQIPADPSLDPSFIERMQRQAAQTETQDQAQFSAGRRQIVNNAGSTYSESQQIAMRL